MSCNESMKERLDLSESIQYIETPYYYTVNNISKLEEFKSLPIESMPNLTGLLQNKKNCIWLKIQFRIPDKLKNKDLGLFIGQLKTSDMVWINLIPCGSYGRFPPNELPASFGAQHFTLNYSVLRKQDINTIYIKVWTDYPVSMSKNIFIGEEVDTYQTAERNNFFKSKIILCFACVLFLAFLLYTCLHFFLIKFSKSKTYLYYSFLMLFSVITLLPFCLYEIPWLKPKSVSYFYITKLFLSLGIYSTIYFSNKFTVSYLGYQEKTVIKITRIVLFLIPFIATLTIKNYDQIPLCIKYFFPIIFIQFIFTFLKVLKAIRDKSLRKHAIILIACFIPALTGFLIDVFSNNFYELRLVLPQAAIYGWQITVYIFIARLLKRFSDMYIKNTKLKNSMVKFNAKLESEVELRTKELSEKNFILSRGLEAITLVQQEVLPKQNKTFMGWDIAVKYIPLDNEVSGDLYDYYFTNSRLDGLSIIDISGHGIPAGLMSILAKGIISQQYLDGKTNNRPVSDILKNINDIYIQEKVNVENYFTGLLFNFEDFDKNDVCKIQVANAGHPSPLLYKADEDSIVEIKYENPEKQYGFIGVEGLPVSFPTTVFSMSENDVLLCFTDGLTEAMDKNKDEFSKERLINIFSSCKNMTAKDIVEKIMKELKNFLEYVPLSDDLTVIVLKRDNSKDYLEEI